MVYTCPKCGFHVNVGKVLRAVLRGEKVDKCPRGHLMVRAIRWNWSTWMEMEEKRGIKLDSIEFLQRPVEERLQMIREHLRRPPTVLPVFISKTGELEAVVHRHVGDLGRYQVTYWNERGPVGDMVTNDMTDIVEDLVMEEFEPTDSPRWVGGVE